MGLPFTTSLVTGPATEPITLAEAKAHLRVDFTDDDALIAALITAAREAAETFMRRAILPQTWDLLLDGECGAAFGPLVAVTEIEIVIPRPPLIAVSFVKYTDLGGAVQTWDPTLYVVDAPTGPKAKSGRLRPAYLQPWPVILPVMNAFQVRFQGGYTAPAIVVSSLTSNAGVATVTTATAHGYRQSETLTIVGANQAPYNGNFPITAVLNATQCQYAVTGAPASPATGAITVQSLGVPQAIKQAMLLTIGELYEHR